MSRGVTDSEIVRTMESDDGRERAFVVARKDGLARWFSERLATENGETFWMPAGESGLYENVVAAEAAARAELPWLRGEAGD